MQVIPAIDIWEGQVVRLWQGDFTQRQVIEEAPEAVGNRFLAWGLHRWHVVDLSGAKAGHLKQKALLVQLRESFPQVQMSVGGGIRRHEEVAWAIEAGFEWVVVGSVAVEAPTEVEKWMDKWGPERFILAADARGDWLAIRGWQHATQYAVGAFLRRWRVYPIAGFLCTQIERDGTLVGPDLAWYQKLQAEAGPVPLIASGGIRGPQDIEALQAIGIPYAVVGKALYADPDPSRWVTAYRGTSKT